MTDSPPRKPIQPIRALRAIRELLRNPDDTEQVFEIIDALSGNVGERLYLRFVGTETGRPILGERRSLLATLADRPRREVAARRGLGDPAGPAAGQPRPYLRGIRPARADHRTGTRGC